MLAERHKPADVLGLCNCESPRAASDDGAPQCGGMWSRKHWKTGEYDPASDASALRYEGYKFVIAFENTWAPGYVTEKPIGALMADAVPIYFGAGTSERGGGPWLNERRMIECKLSSKTLWALRTLPPPEESAPSTYLTNSSQRGQRARAILEGELAPCVDAVAKMDTDEEAYVAMATATKVMPDRGWTSTERVGRQLREAARGLQSYLLLDAGGRDMYAYRDAAVVRALGGIAD